VQKKLTKRRANKMLFSHKESGQGLVEYIMVLVAVIILVTIAFLLLGPSIGNMFSSLNSSLNGI